MGQYHNSRSNRFLNCGNCGEEVLRSAKACPACGADEATGLHGLEDSYAAELPDEQFDYDEFMQREFGPMRHLKPSRLKWYFWVAGILLLFGWLLTMVGGLTWLGKLFGWLANDVPTTP